MRPFFFFMLFYPISIFTQNAPQEISIALQNILNQALPNEQGAGAILRVSTLDWEWSGASGNGIAGITSGQPITTAVPGNYFRAGSISKLFTACAILQLQEAGLLNINHTIDQYLRNTIATDTIPNGTEITILQLLNHTSGLGDAAANDSCQQDALNNLTRIFSLEENIYCGSQFATLPPDIMFSYSNTNYAILTMILEEVTGETLENYLNTNVFTPAGLTQTYIPNSSEDQISYDHLGCYWWIVPNSYRIDMTIVDATLYKGWANIVSTTSDLIKFQKALQSGQLINNNSFNSMQQLFGPSTWYGLGMELLEIEQSSYRGHSGEVGNTSGLYFCDLNTPTITDGYHISYNFNYQGVDFVNKIDLPVYQLLKNYSTNINEVPAPQISNCFPNPTKDVLHLTFENGHPNTILTITDLNGRTLFEKQLTTTIGQNSHTIQTSFLTAGMYFIKIGNVTGSSYQTFIKE